MTTKIRKPFEGFYPITQRFGVLYKYRSKTLIHYGVDFGCPKGVPILASEQGYVELVKRHYSLWNYGKEVKIKHANFLTHYAHLSKVVVETLEEVKKGQVIGYSGRTGFVRGRTGYHLHFGLREAGQWINPLPHFEVPEKIKKFHENYPGTKIAYLYTVQSGDNLAKLAKLFYKDGGRWEEIFNANKSYIKNPNKIFPGQEIIIPNLN